MNLSERIRKVENGMLSRQPMLTNWANEVSQLEAENEALREGILDAHNTLENIPHDSPKNWGWVDDELTYAYKILDALLTDAPR